MKVNISKKYKSLKGNIEFDFPDFTILTGKNGSGKSHLLEAIYSSEVSKVTDDEGKPLPNIKYLKYNELNPDVKTKCTLEELTTAKRTTWNSLKSQLVELQRYGGNVARYINSFDSHKSERQRVLGYWYERASHDLSLLTEEFVYDNFEICSDQILSSKFATIFKLYWDRFLVNEFHEFENNKGIGHYHVLSTEEFTKKYGPKPWDLINEMLGSAGLPYRTNSPEGNSQEANFSLVLIDESNGVEIDVNDLSTGEKVLMSLALAIYNTKEDNQRPDLLLIDEPDAPLHPEFSKILIQALSESLVRKAGVRVVMTTHSPSTLAIADEECIYRMDKVRTCPVKVSKKQAIAALTQDVDNLRVTAENSRQIFVESKYDVHYYSKIYELIQHTFKVSPHFLAPNNSDGSNCDDVKNMTNALRNMGNDLIYGFIDYDEKNHGNNYVHVLGDGNRYAIENYIFDPLYVVLLLISLKVVKPSDLGLPECRYTRFRELSHEVIQSTIDYVVSQLGLDQGLIVSYTTQNEETFHCNSDYFHIQGHELEDRIIDKWPQLCQITKNKGDNALKNYTLDKIAFEFPEYLSMDFVTLMNKLS